MREEMERRFEEASRMLPAMQAQANAAAVRWVFSVDEIWSYLDLRRRGTDESILPGREGARFSCGFDMTDRPIVLRHFETETVYGTPGSNEPAVRQVPTDKVRI